MELDLVSVSTENLAMLEQQKKEEAELIKKEIIRRKKIPGPIDASKPHINSWVGFHNL